MKKEAVMDVTLLAIIASHRPDLMDHDDIKKLAGTIIGNFEASGTTGGVPFTPPKRRRRRKAKGNGVPPAPRKAKRRRGRAEYTTDIGAD